MKTTQQVQSKRSLEPELLEVAGNELKREHCVELRAPGAPRSVFIARTQDELIAVLLDRGYRMMNGRGRA